MMFRNTSSFVQEFISKYEFLCWTAAFFSAAILSRVVFQGLPSVDPLGVIIFFYGARHGAKNGLWFGATAYYASNFFVIGGQGLWTIPMVIGAAGLGAAGAMFRKHKYFGIVLGTVFYEAVVNIAMLPMFPNLLAALPFGAVHVLSNIGFVGLGEKLRKLKSRNATRLSQSD